MIINELSLTNFRGYENAMFTFQPGINLIAGVNGAGKSTILDAIRILMSRVHRQVYKKAAIIGGEVADIRLGAGAYDLAVRFEMAGRPFEFIGHLDRDASVKDDVTQFQRSIGEKTEVWRRRMRKQLQNEGFEPEEIEKRLRSYSSVERPTAFRFAGPETPVSSGEFALFFSAHRSLLTQEQPSSTDSGVAGALQSRRFNLRQAAEWWLAQEALSNESERFGRRADAIRRSINEFLPNSFQAVHPLPATDEANAKLLATKDGQQFDLFELSDGERGILALVFEIARRLAIAYPELDDPTKDGAACILIDEIELHLHPQWQGEVLGWLEQTFPKCQFIATTHSPVVWSTVNPDRVWMIDSTTHSVSLSRFGFGNDANWILEFGQMRKPMAERFSVLVEKVDNAIGEFDLETAKGLLEEAVQMLSDEGVAPETNPEIIELRARLGNLAELGD